MNDRRHKRPKCDCKAEINRLHADLQVTNHYLKVICDLLLKSHVQPDVEMARELPATRKFAFPRKR